MMDRCSYCGSTVNKNLDRCTCCNAPLTIFKAQYTNAELLNSSTALKPNQTPVSVADVKYPLVTASSSSMLFFSLFLALHYTGLLTLQSGLQFGLWVLITLSIGGLFLVVRSSRATKTRLSTFNAYRPSTIISQCLNMQATTEKSGHQYAYDP
jgi:hypothetical protein